jgi:hypothetical protein
VLPSLIGVTETAGARVTAGDDADGRDDADGGDPVPEVRHPASAVVAAAAAVPSNDLLLIAMSIKLGRPTRR